MFEPDPNDLFNFKKRRAELISDLLFVENQIRSIERQQAKKWQKIIRGEE
jgi:hypothetical protein